MAGHLMSRLLLILLMLVPWICWPAEAFAVNIDNPQKLAFVADRLDGLIDVIDVDKGKVVFTIETGFRVDQLLVSPYTPTLLYANKDLKTLVFYDLSSKQAVEKIELSMTPRHLVLDTTGLKAGVSDDLDGGFALFSLTTRKLLFFLPDFPATGDVLFDPNDVDVYFTNPASGALGSLNINTRRWAEMSLTDTPKQLLSPPSRSLDGRQIYVANKSNGEIFNINTFSQMIFKTFNIGSSPARPYTTPQGTFLYLMDEASGRVLTQEQGAFKEYADIPFGHGINAVAVGRFDRYNLFLSTRHPHYYFYDNLEKALLGTGEFPGTPLEVLGSADGRTAYVAFSDLAKVAMVDLENQAIRYFPATRNGAGAFTIGLSNNVCH
jgi:DNA-binding beta-propeller fold protein YncE